MIIFVNAIDIVQVITLAISVVIIIIATINILKS